jgi:hypothetical protein
MDLNVRLKVEAGLGCACEEMGMLLKCDPKVLGQIKS